MTAQPTSTLSTVTRAALAAALIVPAGVLTWIALLPTFAGQPGILFGIAVAVVLLLVRRRRQGAGAPS